MLPPESWRPLSTLTLDLHIPQSSYLFSLHLASWRFLYPIWLFPSDSKHSIPTALLLPALVLTSPSPSLLHSLSLQQPVLLREDMLRASARFSLLNMDHSLEHKSIWMPASSLERAFSTCLSICRIWIFDSQTLESENASFSLHDQQHLRQLHSENNTQYAYAYIKAAWHWHFKCRIKLIWPLFSKST